MDRERSLSHLHRGPSDFFDVDSSLDRTYPKDILPFDSLDSFICSANRLVNSPSGPSCIAVEGSCKIKNHANVSVDLLLVRNDLRGLHAYMSILEDLVQPRI